MCGDICLTLILHWIGVILFNFLVWATTLDFWVRYFVLLLVLGFCDNYFEFCYDLILLCVVVPLVHTFGVDGF